MRQVPNSTLETPPARGSSLSGSVRSLLSAVVQYLETRSELVKLEAGQALRHGLYKALLALFALTCLFIAYVTGMVALTLWIADEWWSGRVLPASLVVAGSHLLLAIVSGTLLLWSGRGAKLFELTRQEFQEDKRWLHPQTETSKN
jgi:uncharacterized membrane protein YqjE